MKPKSHRVTRGERRLLKLGSCLVVLLGFTVAWWIRINAPLVITPPPRPLPNPNAYDFFVKAGQSIVPSKPAVDALFDRRTTPASPAQARVLYSLAKREAWLKKNAIALQQLRQGLRHDCLVPESALGVMQPQFRDLARLMVVESKARAERGDARGAAQSAQDGFAFGCLASRGGVIMDQLVGLSVQAYGIKQLMELAPQLDAATARAAARSLEQSRAKRWTLTETLQEEKVRSQLNMSRTVLQGARWRIWPLSLRGQIKMLTSTKRQVLENHDRTWDQYIAAAQQPYPLRPKPTLNNESPADMLLSIYMPVVERSWWNVARGDANSALAMLTLALRAYHLEHNTYPATLDALAPGYLKKVPLDPFGHGEALHYKRSGDKYVLWSVGPDSKDDGGEPIDKPAKPPSRRNRYLVDDDSTGDIVAGINR